MLAFRKATLADRPAMLEICATVWDGDDYLPSVFDRWVTEPQGQFAVLELDGKAVALGKLTWFAPGEHWLEGIRVHGAYRGRGLAAALHEHLLGVWRDTGAPGALRLVSGQAASLKICERTGFARIFEFAFAEAPAADGSHDVTPVTAAEAGHAFDRITWTPLYDEQHHLCDLCFELRQ